MGEHYDPTEQLIRYFAASRRSRTTDAAYAQGKVERALGLTGDMTQAEVAERIRAAVERVREGGSDG